MLDEFMENSFAESDDEHNNAVLSIPSDRTLRDGETFLFLTCKVVFRTAKSEIDNQAIAQDQTRQLVQSYFEAGGISITEYQLKLNIFICGIPVRGQFDGF